MPFSEKISTAASSNSRRRSSAGRLRLPRLLGPVALLAGLVAFLRSRFLPGPVWHGKRAVGMFVFRRDELMRRSLFVPTGSEDIVTSGKKRLPRRALPP